MLPTSKALPLDDARRKVALVEPREVAKRLEQAGFKTRLMLDGVLATRH